MMKTIFVFIFSLLSVNVWAAKAPPQVCDGILVEAENFAIDSLLANLPADSQELTDVMIFATDAFLGSLEELLKNPQLPKKVDEYPEYKEILDEDWAFGMERLDEIADKLFGGDKQAAIQHMENGQESTIRQFEFEKLEFMNFLTTVGPLTAPHGMERRSRQAWMIRDVPLAQARNLLKILEIQYTWLRYIKIFKAGSELSNCGTGACSL